MAAVINHVPLAGDAWGAQPLVEGRSPDSRAYAVWRVVSPGYLATAGIRLEAGRDFTLQDGAGAPPVVLVNAAFAQQSTRGRPGRATHHPERRRRASRMATVVGVVGDVRQQEWSSPASPEVYVPLAQTPAYLSEPLPHLSSMTVVARTLGDPHRSVAAIRAAIWRWTPTWRCRPPSSWPTKPRGRCGDRVSPACSSRRSVRWRCCSPPRACTASWRTTLVGGLERLASGWRSALPCAA